MVLTSAQSWTRTGRGRGGAGKPGLRDGKAGAGNGGKTREGAGAGGIAGAIETGAQRTSSSSMSKIRLAFGGIGPAPELP